MNRKTEVKVRWMAIPDFQSIMLPVLKIAADGQEHNQSEIREALALQFQLTQDEREEMLPSGRQARFSNRVAWSIVYLRKAGLIENSRRGIFHITEEGLKLLKKDPSRIDIKLLRQYPGIQEWNYPGIKPPESSGKSGCIGAEIAEATNQQTPEEVLEASYQELRSQLAQELLDKIMTCSPKFFEKLVLDLLVGMGYGGLRKDAGEAIGRSGDGGIDGIIKEDKLGLDVIYIQAKRWNGTVGRPVVQTFAGSLDGKKAKKGIFITTSQFSKDAKDFAAIIEKKIILIDGEQLSQYMIDNNVGVAEKASYSIKRMDLDYFDEEAGI
jgi:restriction system protein